MTSNAILVVGVLVFAFFLLCSATTIGALVGLFGFLVEVVQVRGVNRRAALRHEADDAHHVYIPGRRRGTAVGDIGVDEVAAVRQLVDRLTQDVVTPRCVRAFSLSLDEENRREMRGEERETARTQRERVCVRE